MNKINKDSKLLKNMSKAFNNLSIAKKFLIYSFKEISYKYDDLTDAEKKICMKAEFKALVKWIKEE